MTADEVLARYLDEELPDFTGMISLTVNQRGRFDSYPLNIACVRGAVDEVAALIAGGADINAVGELGNQAIHEAIECGSHEIVQMLLAAGARIDTANDFGKSPSDLAKDSENAKIRQLVASK
mgnify:CR=1 FL=1